MYIFCLILHNFPRTNSFHVLFLNNKLQKSGDYLAIPVTINLVLILADILLIWATAARIKLWLWPWMILHTIELLFFITLLVLLMVLIDEPWIKVRSFLILVIFISSIFTSIVKVVNLFRIAFHFRSSYSSLDAQ